MSISSAELETTELIKNRDMQGLVALQNRWDKLSERAYALGDPAKDILEKWENGEYTADEFECLLERLKK
jgi:hypothetical protein